MSVIKAGAGVEAVLNKIYGITGKIKAEQESLTQVVLKGADAYNKMFERAKAAAGATGGAAGGGGRGAGGGLMPTSLGAVPPVPGPGGVAAGAAGGGAGGAGGAGLRAMAGSPAGRAASVAAGVGTFIWNNTPGPDDTVNLMASLFPAAYAATPSFGAGQYDKMAVGRQILRDVRDGSSGELDPFAAASLAQARGFTYSGQYDDVSMFLNQASFEYKMSGMSNPAAVSGVSNLYHGSSNMNDRLFGIGIQTVNPDGSLRDPAEIVAEVVKRSFGGRTDIEPEVFERELSMGFLGDNLRTAFGDDPAMYQMSVNMARTMVKSQDFSLKTRDGSLEEAANRFGLIDSPGASVTGPMNTAKGQNLLEYSEGAYAGTQDIAELTAAINRLTAVLTEKGGILTDIPTRLLGGGKGFFELLSGMGVPGLNSGGDIESFGGSTHDKIPAVLSHGEYVLNARAVKLLGKEQVESLNALGHEFGAGFASPAPIFLSRGGAAKKPKTVETNTELGSSISGSQIVSLASQYVGNVPYIRSDLIRGKGKSPGPENGWDCSTFVQWVYGQFGVKTPGYSDNFLSFGNAVDKENLAPGDILVWNTMNDRTAGHVSIYAGNGEHVHAANKDAGTVKGKISDWYWSRFLGARRADTDALSAPSGDNGSSPKPEPGVNNILMSGLLTGAGGAGAVGAGVVTAARAAGFSLLQAFSLSGLGKETASGALSNAAMFLGNDSTSDTGSGMKSLVGGSSEQPSSSGRGFLDGILDALGGAGSGIMSLLSGLLGNSGDSTSDQSGAPSGDSGTEGRSYRAGESMDNSELLQLLQRGGFKGERLREAWAIVMRESNGRPMAHNPRRSTGDNSYGLFQINMLGSLGPDRINRFGKYGLNKNEDLHDPWVNTQVAAHMSQKGNNWKHWKGGPNQAPRDKRYLEYYRNFPSAARQAGLTGYSHGSEYVARDEVAKVHQGELIMPAQQAQMFREALQEVLSGARGGPREVNITLNIERASEEEAERFAKKVITIMENNNQQRRLSRL